MATSNPRPFAARRAALGLSRQVVASLAHVSLHLIYRQETGREEGRPMTAAEAERLDLLYLALERARAECACLAGASA
jgi:predicted transcriptional regulator